jgi:hypothetical protein
MILYVKLFQLLVVTKEMVFCYRPVYPNGALQTFSIMTHRSKHWLRDSIAGPVYPYDTSRPVSFPLRSSSYVRRPPIILSVAVCI